MGWIFKISQFFDYQGTPDEDRITVASFYMDGPALSRFQWMFRNGFITLWPSLLQALETRFASSFYDDPKGALFKLTQHGIVNDYLNEFEHLANRIVGLAPSFLLSCFIFGLSPDIHREVQALQPLSLPQAMALAKLHEDKIEDRHRDYRGKLTTYVPSTTTNTTTTPLLPTPPKIHFCRLSPEERVARREKGLCFNCDKKFGPNHNCKARFFLLISQDDDQYPDPDPSPPLIIEYLPTYPDNTDAQISFNALLGSSALEAFRLYGQIGQSRVTILIDGGSMHNFVQTRVAKFLALPTKVTHGLKVTVGNGTVLDCLHMCPHTTVSFQGCTFDVMYSLLVVQILYWGFSGSNVWVPSLLILTQ